jgi:SulP family sulfate permease
LHLLKYLLPLWITQYPKRHLGADLLAGLVVTVLVLPQSLAYAMLAGLPPQAGLYVSILPVVAYALVGSSMTQAVGPVAITAIMTYSVLSPLAVPGSTHYLALAALLAMLSGVLVLALGLLRMGFLSNLLSRPVVNGFIAGSAFLILLSQLKLLLGMEIQGASAWAQLESAFDQRHHANLTTLLLGGVGMIVLLLSRTYLAKLLVWQSVPQLLADLAARLMPLLVLIFATCVVVLLDLDRLQGVAVVGQVKNGLPDYVFYIPKLSELNLLLVPALILAFIGIVQNISMAQALAMKRRERVDANRELIGLGLSNIVASIFGGMPVGGGLSRSAVNLASGAQTPLASIVSAFVMLCLVLLGTGWFGRIPLSILAASIMVAALQMIDVALLRRAWTYDRADAFAFIGTALGVLMLGLQMGIVLGIGFSMATLLYRASTPHIAVVGRIVGTEHFRNIERHGVQTLPGVLFLRIDESIFFGNLRAIESRLLSELFRQPDALHVVLIMSAVNRVDLTGLEALTEIQQDLRARGIELHLAEIKGPVQDRMMGTELWKNLSGRIHLSANTAFELLV